MGKTQLRQWILAAEMAAFLAIFSQITIPLGFVPLTGQTLAVGLIATVCTLGIATRAIGLYLLLGLIGLPVYAAGGAGIGVLFGPTGGYLWGFLVYALLVKWPFKQVNSWWQLSLGNLLGAGAQLIFGTVWLKAVTGMAWSAAWGSGVIPFILPGIIKIFVIVGVVILLKKRLTVPFGKTFGPK